MVFGGNKICSQDNHSTSLRLIVMNVDQGWLGGGWGSDKCAKRKEVHCDRGD